MTQDAGFQTQVANGFSAQDAAIVSAWAIELGFSSITYDLVFEACVKYGSYQVRTAIIKAFANDTRTWDYVLFALIHENAQKTKPDISIQGVSFAMNKKDIAVYGKSESEIQEQLYGILKEDFYIWREMKGTHSATQKEVRADLIVVPKRHLIESGFNSAAFAIEVKRPYNKWEVDKSYIKGLAQLNSYLFSKFYIDAHGFSGEVFPLYGFMYPDHNWFGIDKRTANAMYYFRIGQLEITHFKQQRLGWRFYLSGVEKYFTKYAYSSSGTQFRNHETKRIPKQYVGSSFLGYLDSPNTTIKRKDQS